MKVGIGCIIVEMIIFVIATLIWTIVPFRSNEEWFAYYWILMEYLTFLACVFAYMGVLVLVFDVPWSLHTHLKTTMSSTNTGGFSTRSKTVKSKTRT